MSENPIDGVFWNPDTATNTTFVQTFDRLVPGAAKLVAKASAVSKESDEAEESSGQHDHIMEERLAAAITLTSKSLSLSSIAFEKMKSQWEDAQKRGDREEHQNADQSIQEVSADQERFASTNCSDDDVDCDR